MAVKYNLEYLDVENIKHIFELYDDNYTGDPIPVNGSVVMDYGEVDENLEAIRGQGLRVDLAADSTLTFEELFEEQEKTFKVIYYRDSVILFQGWLNPEGFFEDYVNDKWVVSFDCIDGLGYLKNLAFVNSDGTNITGIKTQLEILSLALRRTGIEVDINIDIDVFYTGLADTSSILENVKANTKRYIKDDDFTVMNCEEVIRDVLEPYGAVLTSYNGQWAIYKPNQLFNNTEATFFRYDYLGNALSPTTITFEFGFSLGSQIDNFYPHYCNSNQSFTNKPSFGAYRISYKYGLIKSLIENSDLYTADGSTYDDFTIVNTDNLIFPPAGSYGLSSNSIDTLGDSSIVQFITNPITIDAGASFEIEMEVFISDSESTSSIYTYHNVVPTIESGLDTYYYDSTNGTWGIGYPGDFNTFSVNTDQENVIYRGIFTSPPTPVSGEFFLSVRTPFDFTKTTFKGHWNKIGLKAISSTNRDVKGEIFTFDRTTKPSARIEKTREVFTGDSNLDVYEGTLYKADGTTPTETWYRKGVTEDVPILELMGSETMRMNANTMRIFSGDVYGYFNYLSIVSINNRSGLFGVTKYSYDTKNNITSVELKQLFGDELTDLTSEKTLDYGNVVEPTIRG